MMIEETIYKERIINDYEDICEDFKQHINNRLDVESCKKLSIQKSTYERILRVMGLDEEIEKMNKKYDGFYEK